MLKLLYGEQQKVNELTQNVSSSNNSGSEDSDSSDNKTPL